ncbi:MAG: hypothetical protein WBB74_02555 [Gaiellaceae bacterium]
MGRALLVVPIILIAAGAGRATVLRSGLYGVVTRGPISPVCVAGKPCDGPAVGVKLTFVRSGVVVASVRTGEHGRYRIRLAPGRYSVRGPHTIEPGAVKVPSTRFRHVDFSYDTGIR